MRSIALGFVVLTTGLFTVSCGGAKYSSYTSVDVLRTDAVRAGLACPTWTRDDLPDGTQAGSCSENSRLFVYKDGDALDAAMDEFHGISERTGMAFTVLIGDNWAVNDVNAAMLQKELGGKIVTN